jgi:hypothetical protein
MNVYTLLIAIVLGLGLVPSPQTTRAPDPEKPQKGGRYLPTKLYVRSVSFGGNTTLMVWDGKVLQLEKSVERGKYTPREEITPSEKSWKKFWEEMDAIGIWTWNAEYINKELADGHFWEVLVEYGDKKIHSRGSNMYPAQFKRYEKAVLELQEEKAK